MKTLLLKLNLVLMIAFCITTANANDLKGMINPPENDLIENAINIALGPVYYSEDDVNFLEATNNGDGGQQGGCATALPAVWYKFTATKSGLIGAQIAPANNAAVVFYSAPNEGVVNASELTYVDSPDNHCDYGSVSSIDAIEGTTYYIYMTNETIADVSIYSSQVFAVPENDLIIDATYLNEEAVDYEDWDVHFLMATNTDDGGQSGCDSELFPAIWYKFTANSDGQVDVYMSENGTSNILVFYAADDLNASSGADLTWVDQPNNICGGSDHSFIDAVAGTSYYILAGSYAPYITVNFDLTQVLGTSDHTIDGFTYYPNPVTNEINISANSSIEMITIFNLLGQQVYSKKIGNNSSSINLSHLNKGMYIMTASSEGASASYKIIKK